MTRARALSAAVADVCSHDTALARALMYSATPSPKKPKKSAASADKVVLEGDATPRAAPAGDATSFELRVAYHNVGGLRALLKSEERRCVLCGRIA